MADNDSNNRTGESRARVSRRRVLAAAGASGIVGLAGCAGGGGGGGGDGGGGGGGGGGGSGGGGTAGTANGGDGEFQLGTIFPRSGNLAELGTESFRGVELAVKERNNNGGLGGNRKIKIVSKDAPDAKAGVSAVESLATVANVPVTVGTYSSTISSAASKKAASYNLPYWELGAVADKITDDANLPNLFRTNPKASFFGESGVETAANVVAPALDKDPKELKVAVMYESGAYGNSVAGTVKKLSKEKGMSVVNDIEYDASTSDLSSSIQNLKSSGPDLINHTGYSSDIYLLWNQSEKLNNYIPAAIGNGGGYSLQSFVENIGTTTSLGVLNQDFTQYNTNPEYAPGIKEFVDNYRSEYGSPPLSGHSLGNYFGTNVLLDTLEKASSTEVKDIADAALSLDREIGTSATSWGVKFDQKTHQNTRTRVTGHQWQKDTYENDLWHPSRTDGTADLYTVFPKKGRLSQVNVKNIPRPKYASQ